MRTNNVNIEEVRVEDRFRQDLGDIEELADSVKQYGLLQPITVDQDLRLLAGGRRLAACKLAGMDKIPAVIRRVEAPAEAFEIELIENIHRKDLSWQERVKLEHKIYGLKGTIRAAAGVLDSNVFSVHESIQLAEALEAMPELVNAKSRSEASKILAKAKETVVISELRKRLTDRASKGAPDDVRSEAFRHADNHYKIGDAIEGLKSLNDGVFNFAEVDPPYGVGLPDVRKSKDQSQLISDYTEVPEADYGIFIQEVSSQVFRILDHNAFCAWWFGWRHFDLVLHTLRGMGFTVDEVPCIWNKGNQGQTNDPNARLASCHEGFFIARKGRPALCKPGRSNVFSFAPVDARSKIHATERPPELMDEILATFCYPSQRLLVPFLGSGATLMAAYRAGQVGVGWDLEQSVKDKFLIRVQEWANAKAAKGVASNV